MTSALRMALSLRMAFCSVGHVDHLLVIGLKKMISIGKVLQVENEASSSVFYRAQHQIM